jgi:hypothetical protein
MSHRCPAPGCQIIVKSAMLACKPHWFQLSKPVREAIWATVGKSTLDPDRRAALTAAMEEWRA